MDNTMRAGFRRDYARAYVAFGLFPPYGGRRESGGATI